MIFSLVVSAHPCAPAARCALSFCQALIKQKLSIYRVFFLGEGVLNSAKRFPLYQQWVSLGETHKLESLCCINSALTYELVDARGNALDNNPYFIYSGLGQLIEAIDQSKRVVCFGQRHR